MIDIVDGLVACVVGIGCAIRPGLVAVLIGSVVAARRDHSRSRHVADALWLRWIG